MSKRFRWLLTGACALLAVLCAVAYGEEVRAQIQAVYDAGYEEWILWDAKVTYHYDGLLLE